MIQDQWVELVLNTTAPRSGLGWLGIFTFLMALTAFRTKFSRPACSENFFVIAVAFCIDDIHVRRGPGTVVLAHFAAVVDQHRRHVSMASAQALASLMTSSLLHFEEESISKYTMFSSTFFRSFMSFLTFRGVPSSRSPSMGNEPEPFEDHGLAFEVGQLVGFAVGVISSNGGATLPTSAGTAASAAFFFAGEKRPVIGHLPPSSDEPSPLEW